MILSEEEKKRREEEARSIINMNNISDTINSINYANMKKQTITTNSEAERLFVDKVNEANNIINSVNPRQNISAPSLSDEEKISSQKNADKILNLIDGGDSISQVEDNQAQITTVKDEEPISNNQERTYNNNQDIIAEQQSEQPQKRHSEKEIVDLILNKKLPNSSLTEEEKNVQEQLNQQKELYKNQANSDKNLLSQLGKTVENLWLGAVSGAKSLVSYFSSTDPLNENQKAQQLSHIAKNNNFPSSVRMQYLNENKNTILNDIYNKDKKVTVISNNLKESNKQKNIPLSEESKSQIENELVEYTDAYGKIELNPIRRILSKSIAQNQNKVASNVNKISNPVLKKISELAPSTGNSLLGAGVSFINPYLGMSYFMLSASGSYEVDGRNRGMDKDEARDYGMVMGWAEGASEMIGVEKFLSAGSSLRKGAIKQAIKEYGIDMADNAIQEAIIDPIDELTAKAISGKTKNDYSTSKGYKELSKDMIKDGIDGALSSLLMNGVGIGIDSSIHLYNKIQNGENITQQEIINAYSDIQNEKGIDVSSYFKDSIEYQKEKYNNGAEQVYSIIEINQDGNVTGISQVIGSPIDFNNNNIDISPAVVYYEGNYNIIDTQSGTKLDTTLYETKQDAIDGFNSLIKNIDNATISNVNNQVTKNKLALVDKIQEIQEKILQNPEEVQKQNSFNFVDDDRLFTTEETKQILKGYGINKNVNNRPYIGKEINDIINNNIEEISQDKKSDNFGNETTNYIPKDNKTDLQSNNINTKPQESTFYNDNVKYQVSNINEIEKAIGKNKSYSLEEIGEKWSDISENTWELTLNDDNYVSLDENTGKLEAVLYDGETGKAIDSVEIKQNKNGKYTSNSINSAIKQVAKVVDENRPIKGQVDVEGNEIRSMKKKQNEGLIQSYPTKNSENKTRGLNLYNNIISQNKDIIKSIENFKNAENNINRQNIVDLATALNVYHKGKTFIDTNMSNKSGNNKMPQIIKITDYFSEFINNEDLRKQALKYARDNLQGVTIVNKDTQTQVDISRTGLTKTFGTNRDNVKMQTASLLDNIIEESIYLNSSLHNTDKNIKYHHYFTPIEYGGDNMLSMITIREITTDKNENHKFYYHDIRKIDNLEKELSQYLPQQELRNKFGEKTPYINNSIPQNNKSVKNDTAINNKSMQNQENNTTKTMKKQINGSTKTQYDSEGKKLTKVQQEYFKDSKVRDSKGNLKVVYHGTNNAGFTEFNRNVNYYTDNKVIANTYTGNDGIYEGYINIKEPIIIDANKEVWSKIDIDNIKIDGVKDIKEFLEFYGASTWKENGKIRTSTADIVSAIYDSIEDGMFAADGIIINNIYDEGSYSDSTGKYLGNDYITFKSNQFKNTTNESPTSNSDIRYMKKSNTKNKSTANNNNTLIAQHNVAEEKLLEALELGGLPVPSIAITKSDMPMLGYGEITLLFDKDTINPTDRRNVTYNSDIYSSRKPQTGNMLDKNKIKNFEKTLEQYGISYGYINQIEEELENNNFMRVQDYLVQELQRNNKIVDKEQIEKLYAMALDTIQEKRIMRTDVDPYTPSGNRRTIEQMSLPYTLDNIVALMTKKSTKGSESNMFSGLPEVRANTSQKLKSIDEMHKKENNIISEDEMLKVKENLRNQFHDIIDKIAKYDKTKRYFGSSEVVANALNETAKAKNITKEVLDNELNYVSIDNVPDNLLQEAIDFLNELKNAPTEYFESKPQRAVGFDEVKKAIVPKDVSKDIIDKLKEKGVKVEYYQNDQERKSLISNSEDIRFSKKNSNNLNNNIDNAQRNAERQGSYIEEEIQKIEKTGKWDNTIPVTKLSDIRKTIEDYLGLGIKKGHFRQSAYAIYKGNRDVIRTKEFKDMDSILHETGHALDLGNRLKVDKESIANELLAAIAKLGGYENESRAIRLEEGFAEVIREYSIVPDRAKLEYPQTFAVIEKIRQNDKAFDNFISKVQQQAYNYIHQNPRNRTLSNISIGEQTDKTPLTKEWLKQEVMRNVYDTDYVIKSTVSTLQKAGGKTVNQLKASDNAYLLTRLSSGVTDKVTSMLADGYIDTNGKKLMPGLNQIGEILGNDPQRFNDLRAYLVARRDTDYKAKTLKTGIRSMDSQSVIEQFKNDKQIQDASKLVYDTLDGVMKYAVKNNLITQETADSLKESNAFYVPMQRVLENNGNQVGRKGAVSDIIKKRTGSELDIKDVLENIIANSSNVIQQVENNNVLKALYKQGESVGITGKVYDVIDAPMVKIGTAKLSTWENELKKQGVDTTELDLEKTIDLFAPNTKIDAQNLITSFINDDGKRVYLQFNDEILFNSLMNIDKKFMSQVLKINAKLNMPLRYGATMANVGFAIPNMISDTAQASIFSTAGFIPVVDNTLGVLDVLAANNKSVRNFVNQVAPGYADKINNLYAIYQQTGATSSTRLSQYRESTQNIMKDVYGTKNSETLGIKEKYKPLKRLLDILTYIPELSEQSTRFRVFEKNYEHYKNKGTSEMDTRILAAMESRDATQDFGRTGNLTREINQLIPFSAARVGSAYTFAEKVKANPKQVGMRIAVMTVLAMAIKAIGYDDDEIEELNQRKKDDNFVLKIGSSVVTIKKPQGILRSMINLAEYIQDLTTGHIEEGKEGERLGNWLNNAIMDNMPTDQVSGLVPNMVAPVIENFMNKDFYYNTDIVKSYDLDLPDSEQYYDYNSQLAIWLGKAFNYSPAKIDNLISGYFAGLGTQVTNIMDYALGKIGATAEKPEMGAETNAIGKRFIVNVNSNSASIDEIYNRKTELTKLKNGGNITDEQEKELETITSALSNISNINKQIKSIKKDLTMSGKEKAEEIKSLQQQKTDTARQALGKDVIYSENEENIQSTQFYPSRDTLSKNNRTLTMTTDMKKEYEQLAYEYYKQYENQGLYSDGTLEKVKSKAKDYAKNEMMKKYKDQLVNTKK